MDKLRAMRYFAAVARTSSFTRAAAMLSVPASSISRRIGDLESELGVALFRRSTRHVGLTELGELYYSHVADVLHSIEQADEVVREQSQAPSGTLRITATPTYAEMRLLPSVSAFRRRYPDIVVDLNLTDEVLDLSGHALDIAIRATARPPDNVVARKLSDNRFQLVASPEFVARSGLPKTLSDLARFRTLHYRTPDRVFRWQALRDGEWTEVESRPAFVSGHAPSLLSAALDGEGIALIQEWAVATEIAEGRLRRIVLEDAQLSVTRTVDPAVYLLFHSPKFRLQKVRVAVDFLLSELVQPTDR